MAEAAEPTSEQLASFNTLSDVVQWAELDGDVEDPQSVAGSFLQMLGAKANTQLEIAGSIKEFDWKEAVRSWKIGVAAHNPTPIQKAQIDMIGLACRLAAGVEKPAAVRQKEAEAAAQKRQLRKRRLDAARTNLRIKGYPISDDEESDF